MQEEEREDGGIRGGGGLLFPFIQTKYKGEKKKLHASKHAFYVLCRLALTQRSTCFKAVGWHRDPHTLCVSAHVHRSLSFPSAAVNLRRLQHTLVGCVLTKPFFSFANWLLAWQAEQNISQRTFIQASEKLCTSFQGCACTMKFLLRIEKRISEWLCEFRAFI